MTFDEQNFVSCADLASVMALAERAGLSALAEDKGHLTSSTRLELVDSNPLCGGLGR